MKAESKIKIYEINGEELPVGQSQEMVVSNHWNRRAFVRVEAGGAVLTVDADDLRRAITNAENAHRH